MNGLAGRMPIALLVICLAAVVGINSAHSSRATRHYNHLVYAGAREDHVSVIREYHSLPKDMRESARVKGYYEKALESYADNGSPSWFPTVERTDLLVFFSVLLVAVVVLYLTRPRRQVAYTAIKPTAEPPSEGQLQFVRRLNNGIVPPGLTKATAATLIRTRLNEMSLASRRQRIDISPFDFMSQSKSHRERMREERERKRAEERIARQKAQEERRKVRDAQRAQKAEERLYDKRLAEEAKLFKAREEAQEGVVRKARNEKTRTIHEFQDLVNGILADKVIEPQEVRQLKAWLMANRKASDDFAAMLKLIDESLQDGVIDADETQALYEGIIDCLLTLRERVN